MFTIRWTAPAQVERRREAAMSARQIQWALAGVFFVLGGWCLILLSCVMALTITL